MKRRLEDLAIFGGVPAFSRQLHVGRPNIGDRERFLERVNQLLDRAWLTNHGPFVDEFEGEIAQRVGAKHCIAACNGTLALEIAVRAAGLSGEIIVPSFTFIATAHALQWQHMTPVFCDIDPRTHNIDPVAAEALITPRTTGIIGVHVWGRPCDVDALMDVAARHKIRLLFDAAHAFGCSYRGKMIGTFGDAEVLSFHSTKWLNSFEGGAVVTNDDELAAKIRLMGQFGFQGYDNVVSIGTNAKMTEVSAAMGLTSLESAATFIAVNRRNYHQYREELGNITGITLAHYDEAERCNYQYVVLEIDQAEGCLSRDQMQKILWEENSLVRRYFYPGCHRMEPYRTLFPDAHVRLPHTEAVAERVLLLPNGTGIQPDEITTLCALIRFAIEHGQEIGKRMTESSCCN